MSAYATDAPNGAFEGPGAHSLRPAHEPHGPALVDAYKQDGFGYDKDTTRLDSGGNEKPRVSGLLDLKDNVAVHLLAETAIFDSKGYEILSQDEVDDIKRQCKLLEQQIEHIRSDLAIQSKYRDAALSALKLYPPGTTDSQDAEAAQEAEMELSEINKTCEGLAADLWSLEKRHISSQKKLLEHTAGILQHTHKTSKKSQKVPLVNGVPASPESMYTTSNGRGSLEGPDDFVFFGESSLYQSFDQIDSFGRSNPMGIPPRSPVREQQKHLAEEGDKLREENEKLQTEMETLRDQCLDQDQFISDTQSRLEEFNNQLRVMVMEVDPGYPAAPDGTADIDSQLAYLKDSIHIMGQSGSQGKAGDAEPVLQELWGVIQSGYSQIRQERRERRQHRTERGLELDEADMSDDDATDVEESYSLPAFESKIRWLYGRATSLQQQKGVLQRQIKQQRELNNKSDSEKDAAIQAKIDELEETRMLLQRSDKDMDLVRGELSQALDDLENVRHGRSEEEAAIEEAHGILKERNAKLAALERDHQEMQARLSAAEGNLQEAIDAKEEAEEAAEDKENLLKTKQEELDQLSGMVAELKMESAMTKAELDGAYGTRKERAAEVAALHNQSEATKLEVRVEDLEKELKGTAQELTDMVQQSLESEKRIGDLEDEHDRLETEIARLGKEKEQLQEELDNERFKGSNGPLSPGGSRGATHLTESYRAGLRAERKKYEEQLKAEQMARRKVEEELRAMKRAQGPGKSPLSPRPSATSTH